MNLEATAQEVLVDLISAYSPSGEEDEAARVFAEHAGELGLQARIDEVGNVIVERPKSQPERPTIALLGHIDTVTGELDVQVADGVVHGRGAVDAKGPLTAHLLALATLPDDAGVDVRLVAAVGEEATSRGARHVLEDLDPDGLVIAEPTGNDTVGLGYKGRLLARLTARARPTHPGEPSPTASERLLDAIEQLTQRTGNEDRDVAFEETTLRVRELETQMGAETEQARALIDVRYSGEVPDIAAAQASLDGVGVDVEEALPGVRADPRNPLATALRGSLRANGHEPRTAVKTGTSDWNVVQDAWSCPGIAYGPGDAALDHSPDEHVGIVEVAQAARVLRDALARVTATDLARARPAPEARFDAL